MKGNSQKLSWRKIIGLTLLSAPLWGFAAGQAQAVATGPYVDCSSGSGTFEWKSDYHDFDVDSSSGAFGFALNSEPTNRSVLNYRLNLGYEVQNLEDQYHANLRMNGVAFENLFGFSLLRQEEFRWWAGPLLRISFSSGDTAEHHDKNGDNYKTEAKLFEYGAGFATGLNIKVGPHTYLAPTAGIRFIKATGTGTIKNLDQHTRSEDDLSGKSTNLFVNFSLLFD